MKALRIILADDSPEIGHALRRALQENGYQISTFESSLEAWDAVESAETLALLITEIVFPGRQPTGLELAEFTRQRRPEAAIIYMTGNDWAFAIARYEDTPRLKKPFAMNELLAEVAKAICPHGAGM